MPLPGKAEGAAPYQTLHVGELTSRTAPLSWIVEGLFLEAGAGILGGAPKSCKSFFALDLCVAVVSSTACAGRYQPLLPGPVVLLCAEDPLAVISSRLKALTRSRQRDLKDLPIEVIVEPAVQLSQGLDRWPPRSQPSSRGYSCSTRSSACTAPTRIPLRR